MHSTSRQSELKQLAVLFLKLGSIAFGGPAVHIAMLEDEVVKKRNWMSREHFLDLVGATNLIPGPNSTEMTMHIGQERAGWRGLIVAGTAFILPAVIITGVLAWLYHSYGQLPEVQPFLYGIKPAVIAIIAVAVIRLGKKALKSIQLGLLGAGTLLLSLLGVNEILVLFGCGLAGMLLYTLNKARSGLHSITALILLQAAAPAIGSLKIFWTFLKIGALLYGSGYVLFAYLDAELVNKSWMNRQVLIDAVAVGQFTPGPVLSTATFVGWQLNGISGAAAATLGIFLPSFCFVAILNPLIPRMRKSKPFAAFLDAVNVAAVAIILAVCIEMGKDSLADWRSLVIALLSLAVALRFKNLNSAFVVIGGAVLGYLLYLV